MAHKLVKANKKLSLLGGAPLFDELLKSVNFNSQYNRVLPILKYKGHQDSFFKFKALVCSFIHDCDCLAVTDDLNDDPSYLEMINHPSCKPPTDDNYLSGFTEENIYNMQNTTIGLNLDLRAQLEASFTEEDKMRDHVMLLDCDTTKNRQYAQKMEAVEVSHEKKLSLDTQNIFDELGFQYHIDVRPSATHSWNGAGLACANVIRQIKKHRMFKGRKFWMRADAGYYGSDFFNSLLAVGCDFLVAVNKSGKSFNIVLDQIHNWQEVDRKDPKRIKFYDDREVEIGSTNYQLPHCERQLRYVVMRAEKPNDSTLFADHIEYDYFAICTSLDELRLSDTDLILTYRKRAQAENYITEMNYGFDLKHYPCLKLTANKAYAAIASVAYNLLRFIGLMYVDDFTDSKPKFTKKIRKQFLSIPCLVACAGKDRMIETTKF
ncbi:MAG: transposase [Pseudobacteriovorax sp.]|nr:transposase [Pseudobacteriovorax sp.]